MKQIVFSGYLADMYPNGIKVHGRSAHECISALQLWPGFRESDGVRHTVALPDFASKDALMDETDREVIRVDPVLLGASGRTGQYLMIVIGVVLIATGYGAPAGQAVLGGAMTAGQAVSIGVMMVLNGVVGLLMPQPDAKKGDSDQKSNYLSANRNTTKIGTRVALLFGRRRVWGHILSFNVTATTLPRPYNPYDPPPGGFINNVENFNSEGSDGTDGEGSGGIGGDGSGNDGGDGDGPAGGPGGEG